MKTPIFQPGDRVAFSRKFLGSICDYSKESADRRGTVKEIKDYGMKFPVLKVLWDDQPAGDEPQGGLSCNFVIASRIHLEPR